MPIFAMAWCTQAMAGVKAAAYNLADYRLACSCPLLVEVYRITFTGGLLRGAQISYCLCAPLCWHSQQQYRRACCLSAMVVM